MVMKMSKMTKLLIIVLFTLLCYSCQRTYVADIPADVVVYQKNDGRRGTLAYFDLDNLEPVEILAPQRFSSPVWNDEINGFLGNIWILKKGPAPVQRGGIAYWLPESGKLVFCKQDSKASELLYQNEDKLVVIAIGDQGIFSYDMTYCQLLDIFVSGESWWRLSGLTFDESNGIIYYGVQTIDNDSNVTRKLKSFDLKTREAIDIAEGINPSYSKSRNSIAFLGKDGLYLLDLITRNTVKLFEIPNLYLEPVNYPRWSQDGRYIAIHVPFDSLTVMGQEIVVYDTETNTLIRTGIEGIFPSFK